jgi:hypothetical protein
MYPILNLAWNIHLKSQSFCQPTSKTWIGMHFQFSGTKIRKRRKVIQKGLLASYNAFVNREELSNREGTAEYEDRKHLRRKYHIFQK